MTVPEVSVTLSLSSLVSLPAAFVAVAENVNVPEAVSVPEISPVEALSTSPAGSPDAVHVIGVSPAASSFAEYGVPFTASSSDGVIITAGIGTFSPVQT